MTLCKCCAAELHEVMDFSNQMSFDFTSHLCKLYAFPYMIYASGGIQAYVVDHDGLLLNQYYHDDPKECRRVLSRPNEKYLDWFDAPYEVVWCEDSKSITDEARLAIATYLKGAEWPKSYGA